MTVIATTLKGVFSFLSWFWCFPTYLKQLIPSTLFLAAWLFVEMILPFKGWAQAIQDPIFLGTGTVSPYFLPIRFFREPLDRNILEAPGLKAGPVRVHPFLGVAQTFSDNTFAVKKDRKSDTVTTIAPGIQAFFPFMDNHFALVDYRAAQRFNYRFSENDALNQEALARVSLAFPVGLKFDLQGGHTEGFDARGSEEDLQLQDLTTWNTNFLFGQAEYIGSRTGAQIRFRTIKWDFENNGQGVPRDNLQNSVNVSAFFRATRKTFASLGFGITNTTFDDNKQLDSFAYTINTGFRIPASDRITGDFQIGVTFLNFDRAPLTTTPGPGLSAGGDGSKQLFMRGNLAWTPTSRLTVILRPTRTIGQSAVFGSSTNTRTGGYISASQQLVNRFGLTGVVFYSHNKFSGGTNRTDHLYQTRIGLSYRTVKWLGFQLQYLFQGRQSTANNFEYYANGIMFSVQGIL